MVYVLNSNSDPLMPCTNVVARLLLKEHKATVKHRTPFTIKLAYTPETTYTQPLIHGVDTGSSIIGSAVVTEKGVVLYQSEIEVRNDISKKMKRRATYRRQRRTLKTRYRPARFNSRGNSTRTDRFAPTVKSKIDAHLKEIRFVQSLLPVTKLILETASFDMHAMKNPAVLLDKSLYQTGPNYGFANTKAYVLHRDGHQCQHCRGKSKVAVLEVHHLIYRSQRGSDEATNLLTLCRPCHAGVHDGTVILKQSGTRKSGLAHASQMNVIRAQLLRYLPDCQESFGHITKEDRQAAGLGKTHANDAIAIAAGPRPVTSAVGLLRKRCVSKGDYQQTKGVRSEQKIPTGKIAGFRKFDKVRYASREYFIRGRMTSGYAQLLSETFEPVKLLPIPKLSKMTRVSARKSWIMSQETTQSLA